MTTKVADKIIDVADSGITALIKRTGKHTGKIKKIVKEPIDKNAAGLDKVASGTGKVAGAGFHIGAGLVDISAAILLWLSQVFVAGTDGLLADNKILDFMKKKYATKEVKKNKKGEDKKLSKFTKNNPRVAAYLTWYLMLLTAIGGVGIANHVSHRTGEEKEVVKNRKNEIQKLVLDPESPDWDRQIAAVHPYVMAHIFSSEGMIESAYYDAGQNSGTLTIGSGFTINDNIHRDFARKVLGRNLGNGSSVTTEEAYLLASRWLQEKIYPKIKTDFKGAKLDYRLFVMLSVAAYNKGESTYDAIEHKNGTVTYNKGYDIREAVLAGKSKEEIANTVLKKYAGVKSTIWGGLPNKYAVLVQYYLGYISEETILNAIAEAPYTIEGVMKAHKVPVPKDGEEGRMVTYKDGLPSGFFVPDDLESLLLETAPGKRVTKGTPQNRVRSYLPQSDIIAIENGYFGNKILSEISLDSAIKQDDSSEEDLNAKGEQLFFAEKYSEAIELFQTAINENTTNNIVYSNLIMSYYRLGNYDAGVKVAQDLIDSGKIEKIPKINKGYIYYNVALCYEGIADNSSGENAKDNYEKAKENLELSEKYSGVSHAVLGSRLDEKLSRIEKQFAKTTAFNKAGGRIKMQKNDTHNSIIGMIGEHQA